MSYQKPSSLNEGGGLSCFQKGSCVMKGADGVLAFLQDIKNMLGGIGCILVACFLALPGWWPLGVPFAAIGFFFLVRAWFAHEVVHKPDSFADKEHTDAV